MLTNREVEAICLVIEKICYKSLGKLDTEVNVYEVS